MVRRKYGMVGTFSYSQEQTTSITENSSEKVTTDLPFYCPSEITSTVGYNAEKTTTRNSTTKLTDLAFGYPAETSTGYNTEHSNSTTSLNSGEKEPHFPFYFRERSCSTESFGEFSDYSDFVMNPSTEGAVRSLAPSLSRRDSLSFLLRLRKSLSMDGIDLCEMKEMVLQKCDEINQPNNSGGRRRSFSTSVVDDSHRNNNVTTSATLNRRLFSPQVCVCCLDCFFLNIVELRRGSRKVAQNIKVHFHYCYILGLNLEYLF